MTDTFLYLTLIAKELRPTLLNAKNLKTNFKEKAN